MIPRSASWDTLVLGDDGAEAGTRSFYLLQREGKELLAVPAGQRRSRDALALYQPQTTKARIAKQLFALALYGPWARLLPCRKVELRKTEFTDFLASLHGERIPSFTVLSGNPDEPGRRFVFGLFDEDGSCRKSVKCAVDETGCALIETESRVLNELKGKFPSVPAILAELAGRTCRAFALDFFSKPETPPTRNERVALVKRWIRPEPALPLQSLAAWPTLAPLSTDFAGVLVRSVVFHGDFTPWNIRRYHDDWMVIDWEKSSTHGPPLWDLLHYEIHEEILVHRSAVQSVRERIQRLLDSPETSDYLAHCEAKEHAQLLLRGYLAHLDRIYPPIRGRETVDALIQSLA
jgi:hypothetical protein